MNVAIYYEDWRRIGRNDGAPLYAWNALNQVDGVKAVHLIPEASKLNAREGFDLHVWVDWGEDAVGPMLKYKPIECPKPNMYWTSDTHLGYDYRLKKAREFDHVFCMQKRAAEEFKRDGIKNPIWIPHAFEPKAYPKLEIIKRYDVCFVGHANCKSRIDFLDRMFKEFPNFFFGKRLFEQAAKAFCESKIVLNTSIKDDLNMRVFETLGTGSFLLTNNIPTIHELFKDGKHLVTYENTEDAVEKARYYLKNDSARDKIAKAGYEEVINKHTYKHRVEAMLKNVRVEATCL